MADRRYQVFVSSTYKDLIEHRQLVIKSLLEADAIPAGMELFPAADDTAWNLIKRVIDESDYYIVIIGGRYGSTDPDSGLSYTEMEYNYASKRGKPILALLHQDPGKIAKELTEEGEPWEKLQAFRSRVEREKHCKYWSNEGELQVAAILGFTNAKSQYPTLGWLRGADAKTVEDVEERRILERRLEELQRQLSQFEDATAYDEFAQGDDKVEVRFQSSAGSGTAHVTWDQLFRIVAQAALRNPSPQRIQEEVAAHLAMSSITDTTRVTGDLNFEDWEMIERQFVALGYIRTQVAFRPPRMSTERHRFFDHGGWVTGWELTDRGYRKLAQLSALRRSQ